mgnify:FL=1
MAQENFRAGFVTLAGKQNAGKSTLINTLVGEKVSIVSHRPQTTRDKIVGIVNTDEYQAVFVDTPGIHKPKNALGTYMMKSVEAACDGVDAIVYLLACDKAVDAHDTDTIAKMAGKHPAVFVAINKCDEVEQSAILSRIEAVKDIPNVRAIVPISAKTGKNCAYLLEQIVQSLPYAQPYYDAELYTDKTMRFLASEIVREKALRLLSEEVPYGIGVSITQYQVRDDGIVQIDADLICEKQAHKPIVIGKQGAMIKRISTAARIELEKLVGGKVFLTVYVRVKPDWRDSDLVLNELGYNAKKPN